MATKAKLFQLEEIATDKLLGRDTAANGDIEELGVSGGIEFTGIGGIQTSAFTGDATKTAGGTALTLATVNSNVGTFGSTTESVQITVNGKGLITAISNQTIPVITASNGLTKNTNDIVLGGSLTGATTITAAANTLTITTSKAGEANAGFVVTNSSTGTAIKGSANGSGGLSGYGLWGTSVDNYAIRGENTTGIAAGAFFTINSSTNTVLNGLIIDRQTTGAAGTGIGVSLDFNLETSTTVSTLANQLISKWSNHAHADRVSEFSITGVDNEITATLFTIAGSGQLKLNKYGIGTFTGSAAYTLQVDSSGNIIEGSTSGEATTASNGLTEVGNDIQLGGVLTSSVTITGDTSSFLTVTGARTGAGNSSLRVNNTGASGTALRAVSDGTGPGVWGDSTTGTGVYGTSAGIGLGAYSTGTVATLSQIETAGTNTVLTTLQLDRLTTGTAGDGIGSKILFTNETSTTPSIEANSIVSKWSTAAHASRLAEFSITGYNIGVENTLLTLSGTGAAKLNLYGDNTFPSVSPTYMLVVNANGDILEAALPVSLTDSDKGDITVTSSGTVWTIDNGVVSYAKIQDVSATNRILGRSTAGPGDVEEITVGGDITQSGSTFTVTSASTTVAGKVELATIAETNSGADTTRAVTPDGLAGSIYGVKMTKILATPMDSNATTGDGKAYFSVDNYLTGMNLVGVEVAVSTVSTSGTVDVQIRRVRSATPVDMLSTKCTVDANEIDSNTAATPAVINASNDDVLLSDQIFIDVDAVGTGSRGINVTLIFQTP